MGRKTIEEAVAELSQSLGLFVRRLRAASAPHDFSWTESAVIGRLGKDGPSTTADLARAESIKPQSMGSIVAALEERGLLERKPHPSDGRQVYIALTVKGDAVRKSSKDAYRSWLTQAIVQLNEEDRKALFAAGEILKRLAQT